jgi:hypothetical protein
MNGTIAKPGRECGTFDNACSRAWQFANRHEPRKYGCLDKLELAEEFLRRAGWGHATFGVEHVAVGDRELAYLNTGDTYSTTVGMENGRCFLTTWGGWYEEAEQAHCEAEGVIRCGYCGEFTDHPDDVEWSDVECEHCGHNVAGG